MQIPIAISLGVVASVLVAAVTASLLWPKESQRATRVRMESGNPPVFVLTGSGLLAHLLICRSRREDGDDLDFAMWEIEPIGGYKHGRLVEDIGAITYGVVPPGYKQSYPENGAAPPALQPGNKYEYWFDTTNAPHARSYFVIRDLRAVEVQD